MRSLGCSNCNQPGHVFSTCPKTMCNRCGKMGHIGKYCNDETYLSLKNFRCGCNPERILTTRESERRRIDTHCCICKKKELLTRMEKSVLGTKARCYDCAEKAEKNERKRTMTPPMSPRENKRINTPTPYDAMMELTLEEEKNRETERNQRTYAESVKKGLERAVEKKELPKEKAFPTGGINGGKSVFTLQKLQERAARDAGIIEERINYEIANLKMKDQSCIAA